MRRGKKKQAEQGPSFRKNQQIRAREVRVINPEGSLGVMPLDKALALAEEQDLDLVEVAGNATPPVCRIADYGKLIYEEQKKISAAKKGTKPTETKSLQIKIATGENDLKMKAMRADEWLKEGHRIKVELYLSGRSKYMEKDFLKVRLDRVLALITESYKIADAFAKSPKGYVVTIERDKSKKPSETKVPTEQKEKAEKIETKEE
ncbi:MAG: translation initiation factor IF-3 [Flavobacteriaceae bacterium]